MFSKGHRWGETSRSSLRMQDHTEQFLFYLPKYWHPKNCLFFLALFCSITSPTSQRQQELQTVQGNGHSYWLAIKTPQCPRPPVVVWAAQPSLEHRWGAQCSTQPSSWTSWHSSKQEGADHCIMQVNHWWNIYHTQIYIKQLFSGYLLISQWCHLCYPPTLNCFETYTGICQWDEYYVFQAKDVLLAVRPRKSS